MYGTKPRRHGWHKPGVSGQALLTLTGAGQARYRHRPRGPRRHPGVTYQYASQAGWSKELAESKGKRPGLLLRTENHPAGNEIGFRCLLGARAPSQAQPPSSRFRVAPAITSGAVTSGTVTPGAVTPGTVTPGTVTPGTVTPGTVTPGTVTPGTVTPGTVTPGTVTPGTVTPGTVTPGTVTPGTVTSGTEAAGCNAPRPARARSSRASYPPAGQPGAGLRAETYRASGRCQPGKLLLYVYLKGDVRHE